MCVCVLFLMSMYKELSYDNHVARIRGVQFCVLSPDEIVRRSVVEITRTDTYAGNEPVPNGLFDARMGTIDNMRVCKTCEQRNTFCPGHFGHVSLAKPVFYVQFFDVVKKLVRCVCFRCSKLLVNAESPEIRALIARRSNRHKRWDTVSKLCTKVRRCEGCGARQPDRVFATDNMRIRMEWRSGSGSNNSATTAAAAAAAASVVGSGERRERDGGNDERGDDHSTTTTTTTSLPRELELTAEDVLRILRRITDVDAEAMGFSPRFNRPDWMICQVLPVPPPCVRPSVRSDTGQRSEDDLTAILSDIIKYNNLLRSKIERGSSTDTVDMYSTLLQFHVATLVDNAAPVMYNSLSKDRHGRTLRTLKERLKSKDGRIRGNLMGKRVDFSARTVITPDPNISIDELGVPLRIAMNLTFPEVVNSRNIERLRRVVANGPDVYPGAKHVRKTAQGNRTVRLKGLSPGSLLIEEGDVVERHLVDGDYVLFNRQPSLHKMSMMAHRVRVMPHNTFRLNVCVCASYNADFDGDEMNMHVPQSLQTHEELRRLAAVPLHVISPRHSQPLITIVQDVALGVFRMTQSHVRIDERTFMNLTSTNAAFSGVLPPADQDVDSSLSRRWTGRQLLSTVLPRNTNIEMRTGKATPGDVGYSDTDNRVVVRDGQVLQGMLDAKSFKAPTRGLVHSVYNDKGPATLTAMLDNTQKLVCDWLVLSGFSVGVSDLVMSRDLRDGIAQRVLEMRRRVQSKIQDVHAGRFENKSTRDDGEQFEHDITEAMSIGMKDTGSVAMSAFTVRNNRLLNMIESGSKGQVINFTQMVACVGQQTVEGRRITDGFDHRTLPHFTKFDDGPSSRGFVENSFISGLTPQEFFFHSMGGRVGLIDTAVRTSETGYIQRKLIKAMEDCKIHHDLSVRNAAGQVVQFLYGEDGIDAIRLEYQTLPYVDKEEDDVRAMFAITHAVELRPFLRDDVADAVERKWEGGLQRRFASHIEDILQDRAFVIRNVLRGQPHSDQLILGPVGFTRLIENAKQLSLTLGFDHKKSDLDPDRVFDALEDLLHNHLVLFPGRHACAVVSALARCALSPRRLIETHRLCSDAFDYLLESIKRAFRTSVAQPGEMVGTIAAQSIGEPTTQMTLNTFHLSGVSSAFGAITYGVPRLRELFNASRNIKTPEMRIRVQAAFSSDAQRCGEVMSSIQTTRFRDIVRTSRVVFCPEGGAVGCFSAEDGDVDVDVLRVYERYSELQGCGGSGASAHTSPWLIRFEFDKSKMLERQIHMADVHFALLDFYDDTVSCVFSDDAAKALVCRVRLVLPDVKGEGHDDDDEADDAGGNAADPNDILTEIMALEQSILDNIVIRGMRGIERAVLEPPRPEHRTFDPSLRAFVKRPEWTIVTSGTNLMDVLAHPQVDSTRTVTNDVQEVLGVLGIEAARQALYDELEKVMWMGDQPQNVNYRHMALLVDNMTCRGYLASINRHGINSGEIGPLARSSFEQTDDHLVHAGVFSELDRINGVSANIMLGQVAPCGTGDVDIFMDANVMKSEMPDVVIRDVTSIPVAAQHRATEQAAAASPTHAVATPDVRLPQVDTEVVKREADDVVIVD